jgi:DNA-binding IclR family transcriptional regulator
MPIAVPAVEKALQIVRLLNLRGARGAALPEIARDLSMTRSHCYNILGTLLKEGWLAHDLASRCYRLAPGILGDCSSLLAAAGRGEPVHEVLRSLSRETGLPSVLSRVLPGDAGFIAIDKAEESAELIVSVPLGHIFPADAPAQRRAVLAFGPPEVAEAWIDAWQPVAYTANTIVDKATLRREVASTRMRGYALSRGELHAAVMSLAAAVRDSKNDVAFVLQIPGLFRDVADREREVATALLRAAAEIERLAA